MSTRAAVLGGSGFAGAELLRILAVHPQIDVVAVAASTRVGLEVTELYPSLHGYSGTRFVTVDQALGSGADLIFSSLPHTASMDLFGAEGPPVVDLGGDFRLNDAGAYPIWYGREHSHPEILSSWVYGLPELHRSKIETATRVANPGCYPSAAILALAPLLEASVVETGHIHVNALSGVSGAGRAGGEGFDFSSANENSKAYSVTMHKHIPEIEQELSLISGETVNVSFVPHLVPMTRGIIATCVANLATGLTTGEAIAIYEKRYGHEPFVRTLQENALPETKRLAGSNFAEVTARVDVRTGRVIAIAALDNLGKGAAGQAVQNANLMLGLEETTGLQAIGMVP